MSLKKTVLEAKRFGVYHCAQDGTLLQAAERMVQEDISAIVVVDEAGYLLGIITRTDLMRAATANPNWEAQLVQEVMTGDVVTASPETTLEQVAGLLLEKQIHRIVIVREENGKKRPVSVISDADVVYHLVRSQ
jgi:CBS domain-containing protein